MELAFSVSVEEQSYGCVFLLFESLFFCSIMFYIY